MLLFQLCIASSKGPGIISYRLVKFEIRNSKFAIIRNSQFENSQIRNSQFAIRNSLPSAPSFRRDHGMGRSGHPFAQIETRVRRLIVSNILPRDAQSILRIVHQRVQPMGSRNRRRVDPQFFVVRRPEDDFFSPVSEEVGAQSGSGLRSVI